MKRHRLTPVVVILAALLGAIRSKAADDPILHVLLVCDTADKQIGDSVAVDEANMLELMRSGIPKDRLSVSVLKGTDVTRNNILDHYGSLKVGPRDAVLFYFSGHGGTDDRKRHYLKTGNQLTARSDVSRAVLDKHARLVVLFTDCCANKMRTSPGGYGAAPGPGRDLVLRHLFFEHSGLVDVNACAVGETAVGDHDLGGLFTAAFIGQCDQAAFNRKPVSWQLLFQAVVARTRKLNPKQTPTAMSPLRDVVTDGTAALRGVRVVTLNLPLHAELADERAGIVIRKVLPGGPAASVGLTEGDLILAVDGKKMTYRQYTAFRTGQGGLKSARFTIASRCGCGCGGLHMNCGAGCKWIEGGTAAARACDKE